MENLPLTFSEHFKLSQMGIDSKFIGFGKVTLESDKFICVRHEDNQGTSMMSIVDIPTKQVTTHKIGAESAIMNPQSKVVALRAKSTLQVLNLEMKSKVCEYRFEETIQFWNWINTKTIGIVTSDAVYHWSIEGNSKPTKIFEKHEKIAQSTIINYRTDATNKWLLLCGLGRSQSGQMLGSMQLYSVDRSVTQPIEGHAACFLEFKMPNGKSATVVCIAANTDKGGKLFIMEVPGSVTVGFERKSVAVQFADGDFPVAMEANEKLGIIYMVTLKGGLYMYDVGTGTPLLRTRVSNEAIFVTTQDKSNNGIMGINNRVGQVLTLSVDEQKIVSFITKTLNNPKLAIDIAARGNLGGADELYKQQFTDYLRAGNVDAAISLAFTSPNQILRGPQTLAILQKMPTPQGQKPPISVYFQYILANGKLNQVETVGLSTIVLQRQGGVSYIQKLIGEGKMEASEELGDLVRQHDADFAMKIYLMGKSHGKIIDSLLYVGEYQKVLQYCEKVQYQPNYLDLFKKLCAVKPDKAIEFAVLMTKKGEMDANVICDILVQGNLIRQVTSFLLDILKGDNPDQSKLQTRLIEINLKFSPVQVADKILGGKFVTHYDRITVAKLCEQVKLFNRALENYTEVEDRKRILQNAQFIQPDFLVTFFTQLSQTKDEKEILDYLDYLLTVNLRQNVTVVVQIATKCVEKLTVAKLVGLFEKYKAYDGLFYFLGAIIEFSDDKEVHFKYIEAATFFGKFSEVERMTRESDHYEGKRVKEFLMTQNLQDLMPLVNVCDKHDFVDELIIYLYKNSKLRYVEIFVKQRPLKAPVVVGALLDVNASEDLIKTLLMALGSLVPIPPLVTEVEKRNRLKILLNWLEARVNEGSQEPAAHNALAKIYIDIDNNPDRFLTANQFYDSKVVGKFCEKRDPNLAFIAYMRGQCDVELIELTNKNQMFKHQARYLVKRQDLNLWKLVLVEDNKHMKSLIDSVVQTALPECDSPKEVSVTVKAFMAAKLPEHLIKLLEKIVIYGKDNFKQNKPLQNLLLMTAIKSDKEKVKDYIFKLDLYNHEKIAEVALTNGLGEEAFLIYQKKNLHLKAAEVLVKTIKDLDRASTFAAKVNDKDVWSLIGNAYLDDDSKEKAEINVRLAIKAFNLSNDTTQYRRVIVNATSANVYDDLIKFLRMARKSVQDKYLDTELVYSFAKLNEQQNGSGALTDLEEFISQTNLADIQEVGDRCYKEALYEAARILYQSINNHSNLAFALVKLKRNKDAVAAALKANTPKTWRVVLGSCVDLKEFSTAEQCGINLVVDADEIEWVINYYEKFGYFKELIKLMEKGLLQDRTHAVLFTELAILYSKYENEKLMDHLQRYYRKIHASKVINSCRLNHLWAEMRFLHKHNDEPDKSISVMIDYPVEAYDHVTFLDTVTECVNTNILYDSIEFYIRYNPKQLHFLLTAIAKKVDNEKVAQLFYDRYNDYLPLVKKYLSNIQDLNLPKVNEVLNEIYIREEDYESLNNSVKTYKNFPQNELAKKLKDHELLEFRRIAARLFRLNKKFDESILLSKKDKLYKDAIETAAESGNQELSEELLLFFVQNKLFDCFSASLYACYNLIRPDVALELAWKYKIQDMVMPYITQVLREYTTKIDNIVKEKQDLEKKKLEEEKKKLKEQQEKILNPQQDQFFSGGEGNQSTFQEQTFQGGSQFQSNEQSFTGGNSFNGGFEQGGFQNQQSGGFQDQFF